MMLTTETAVQVYNMSIELTGQRSDQDEVLTSHHTWRALTDCCFHQVSHQVSQWSRPGTFAALPRSAGNRN